MKHSARIVSILCAGILAMVPISTGITASAAETTQIESMTNKNIGDDGYRNYKTGTYLCCSDIGVKLKDKPTTDSDAKTVWVVPNNYQINITKTNGRWGYTEVKDSNGTEYKGWTRLDYYVQLFDTAVEYTVNSEYSTVARTMANDDDTQIITGIEPNQKLHITKLFEDTWAYAIDIPFVVNEETGEKTEVEGWININDLICTEIQPEITENTTVRHVNLSEINSGYEDGSNYDIIYKYLRNELGFNPAVAQGVITNMEFESGLNPLAWCRDTNGLISYGICQWNGGRFENLKNYCNYNNLDYRSLNGQLEYLKYELTTGYYWQYSTVFDYENSKQGCMDAAYFWASKFEVCSAKYWNTRAQSAGYEYNASLS